MTSAADLIDRLGEMLASFESPDGMHRALRSQYSRRGTCEIYPLGQHSPLCLQWRALIVEADRFLTEHEQATERQAALFEEASG